ncbi:MAG TPA: hypothetical protein PKD86_03045 [Gemmatales bacterium]|nr:hypothetical protein [Gemmatales bacterium]HMP58309.1 hypothetical protein [Gemmatales bacterium]
MDFDTTARRLVISNALFGAVLGAVPGAVMLFIPDINSEKFARDLLAFGCLIGGQVGAVAAAAGVLNASLRSIRRAQLHMRQASEPHMDRAIVPSGGGERRGTTSSSAEHVPLGAGSPMAATRED